jgi:hypothetical protein
MTSVDILKTQIDDGAFDGAFDGCEPLDIGDGFAVVAGECSVAVCSDCIGGTIMLPWSVIRRVVDMLPDSAIRGKNAGAVPRRNDGGCGLEEPHGQVSKLGKVQGL